MIDRGRFRHFFLATLLIVSMDLHVQSFSAVAIFTPRSSPTITSIFPVSSRIGDTVMISGTGFDGLNFETNKVSFVNRWYTGPGLFEYDSIQAVIISATDTTIMAIVPVGASNGFISVSVDGEYATSINGVFYNIIPTLESFIPDNGYIGDTITITGTGFDAWHYWSNYVWFTNGNTTSTISATPTSIRVVVPIGSITGPVTVFTSAPRTTSEFNFNVLPAIDFLVPASGYVGNEINIFGSGFDANKISNYEVTFNGVPAVIQLVNSTSIRVIVPNYAVTGPLQLKFNSVMVEGSNINFVVNPTRPIITQCAPPQGTIGTPVVITGSEFDQGGPPLTVTFGEGTLAKVDSFSNNNIYTSVPKGARSGLVVVTAGGASENGPFFRVLETIHAMEPSLARVGDTVVVSGSGFAIYSSDFYKILFSGLTVIPISVTDSTLSFIVPPNISSYFVPIIISELFSSTYIELPLLSIIPVITKIEPDTVIAGRAMELEIKGTGIKNTAYVETYNVIFNNTILKPIYHHNTTDTTISITVPRSVPSGIIPVSVSIDGLISNNYNLVVLPDTFPYTPLPPENLYPTSVTSTSFICNWNSGYRILGYILDVSTDNFKTFLSEFKLLVVTDTSKVVSGLEPGTNYQVRVWAYSDTDTSIYASSRNVITIPPPPVAAPPGDVSTSGFISRWNVTKGVEFYKVEASGDSFITFVSHLTSETTARLLITGGFPSKSLQYRVRAANASGFSDYSNIITVLLEDVGKIWLYPNPAKDQLWVSGVSGTVSEANVINSAGKVTPVNLKYLGYKIFTFDISELSSGLYIIHIVSDTNLIKLRFIKE